MISVLRAKNYGCLHDVEARFSRLHALIGPNDSGKSTVLRAIRTLGQFARGQFTYGEHWDPFDPSLGEPTEPALPFSLSLATPSGSYGLARPQTSQPSGPVGNTYLEESGNVDGAQWQEPRSIFGPSSALSGLASNHLRYPLMMALSGVRYLAFSEDGLRKPSGFMAKNQLFLSERGEGLPGLYFTLRNDREEAFERIISDVRALFPTVKTVRAQPRSTTELELEVELANGTRVRAPYISTGLLYYLAFAALPEFFGPVATILLEEPENGLHPARIAQVMEVLRTLSEKQETQIIVTTHSPLVVNEMKSNEVSVVTRRSLDVGTEITAIDATPNFEKRSGVYSLGEPWLSYADGRVEQPLFDPTAR